MPKKVAVIGSGFAGLSAASHLALRGFDVTVFEKNSQAGGRARYFENGGYRFDMGPSWYWMPDVFDRFFGAFGKRTSDYYTLKRLSPSYRIFFPGEVTVDVPASLDEMYDLFESFEKGSAKRLRAFLGEAEYKYKVGMQDLVYKPALSAFEFFDRRVLVGLFKLHLLKRFDKYVRNYFSNPYLITMMEFPVLFLGTLTSEAPALYSMMNYADIKLGTWYPEGGMHRVVQGMASVAQERGVRIYLGTRVDGLRVNSNGRVDAIRVNGEEFATDVVVSGGDYHHVDQQLTPAGYRSYSSQYWDRRVLAPSSLLYYVGVRKKIGTLLHHNLFFDRDLALHAHEIYKDPKWPSDPLFYVSCRSKSDEDVAPEGHEALFILIPVAPGLEDSEEIRKRYFDTVMDRLEQRTGEEIRSYSTLIRTYAYKDFVNDYHSFKGNAYGLANTLRQTAMFKPSMKSKKISNLYFAGQLTVPGPGVPPSIISGEVAARLVAQEQHTGNKR